MSREPLEGDGPDTGGLGWAVASCIGLVLFLVFGVLDGCETKFSVEIQSHDAKPR